MTAMSQPQFTIVMAVKSPQRGKSRLSDLPARQRAALARGFAADVVAVAVGAAGPGGVLVVTDDDDIATLATDLDAVPIAERQGGGLNPALLQGRDAAVRLRPGTAIVALQGDLPAISLEQLQSAIGEARGAEPSPSFVPDATGSGTALLYWPEAASFGPAFGDGSAQRHRDAGAVDLTAGLPASTWAGLRRDVDTTADLIEALALGVGPVTRAVVEAEPGPWAADRRASPNPFPTA
jgi:2-phospho-L-lactate/phosphoenolpyruvate guanylyltransferase